MLQRLFRNPIAARLIKRCNDFGAGGVSVAIGELASGLIINLDSVPKKYEGLDGTELAISESQERMAVVTDVNNAKEFIRLANDENLEATIVATVTQENRLIMKWRGDTIVDISREFLNTNGAKQVAQAIVNSPRKIVFDKPANLCDALKDINIASQKGLAERFDASIGAGTILMPFGGINQLTPIEAMVAKLPADTGLCTFMSFGYDPDIARQSPFHSAFYAVTEALAKLAATGADWRVARLTLQEYFERLNSPVQWGKPLAALLGAFWAQMQYGIPAIGGKDSMSGTFNELNVPPTLVAFALATGSASDVLSPEFKQTEHDIYLLGSKRDGDDIPEAEHQKKLLDHIYMLNKNGCVYAAASIGKGGIAAALAKMSLGNGVGAIVNVEEAYAPLYGSIIIEAGKLEENGLMKKIGVTTKAKLLTINGESHNLDDIERAWLQPLESVFPTRLLETPAKMDGEVSLFDGARARISSRRSTAAPKIASPRVLIPVFPGTNTEYDAARAFEKAGAKVLTVIIRNRTEQWLIDSIRLLSDGIKNSQIIMLPGGFSAGDEPEGSGKFIAAVFRNPLVREAAMDLIKNRDGLALGICNGFQALIKLGLVPYGEIRDMEEQSPTLTYNTIGRHVSCMARTKVVSTLSPWLYNAKPGDESCIPVSHGEGRFIASVGVLNDLARNNQIATQYASLDGAPTYDIRYNPNGSMWAVEGITSPDGRVLGKMAHNERVAAGLMRNIPNVNDQGLFQAGVRYYS
jgi:phosphoribosylformylglycinamidine synthase